MGGQNQEETYHDAEQDETFYDANEVLPGYGNVVDRSTGSQPVGEAAIEHVAIEIVELISDSIENRVVKTHLSRARGRCSIYRVHEKFHKMGERSAYMPEVVAIGPFHSKEESLKAMDECKLLYMNTLLSRTAKKKFKLVDDQKTEELVLPIQDKRDIEDKLVRKYPSGVLVKTGSLSLTSLEESVEPINEFADTHQEIEEEEQSTHQKIEEEERSIHQEIEEEERTGQSNIRGDGTEKEEIKEQEEEEVQEQEEGQEQEEEVDEEQEEERACLESSESITATKTTEGWLTILKECVASIKEIVAKARQCYSERIDLEDKEFVEMMVVDGLFIIELLQRCAMKNRKSGNDPLLGKSWVLSSLTRDLLLLENQIPMIVLKRLFHLIELEDELQGKSLNTLVLVFFNHLVPRNENVLEMRSKCEGAKHLLDLLAKTFYPQSNKEKGKASWKPLQSLTKLSHTIAKEFSKRHSSLKLSMQSVTTKLKHAAVHKVIVELGSTPSGSGYEDKPVIGNPVVGNPAGGNKEKADIHSSGKLKPSVTELRRAGVKFRKGSTEGSFLDIKFSDGVLRIPPIIIEDKTDLLFRNLIAFEQCSNGRVKYMTSYAFFMDTLINSASDVRLLRNRGIITNYLGSDDDVSNLFNNLCCEVIIGKSYFSPLCDRLNKYCEQRWHRWQATMKRDYCNNPCAIISFVAASFLIVLTLTGTLFALLSFFVHKS